MFLLKSQVEHILISKVFVLVCACSVSFQIDWHNDTVFDISFKDVDTPLIMHNVGVAFSEVGFGLKGIAKLPDFDSLEVRDCTVLYSLSLTSPKFTCSRIQVQG